LSAAKLWTEVKESVKAGADFVARCPFSSKGDVNGLLFARGNVVEHVVERRVEI
jgi:hypothetical protein